MSKLRMLWPYDRDNTATWKYIDCIIVGEHSRGNNRFVKQWILNPNFAYKHLDPHYPRADQTWTTVFKGRTS
jgi:hypothetical protein